MTTQATELHRKKSPDLTARANIQTIAPLVDVYENRDEFLVIADFPGVPTELLHVRLEGTELAIEGTQAASERKGSTAQPVAFARTFRVPKTIDPNGVTAELSQGVLRVRLGKSEASKPRRIEVKAS